MPEAQTTDVAGCLAVLTALKDLALDYKAVMADGKVDAKDLAVLGQLALQFSDITAAVSGAKTIGAELKDLSEDEVKEIAGAAFGIYAALK